MDKICTGSHFYTSADAYSGHGDIHGYKLWYVVRHYTINPKLYKKFGVLPENTKLLSMDILCGCYCSNDSRLLTCLMPESVYFVETLKKLQINGFRLQREGIEIHFVFMLVSDVVMEVDLDFVNDPNNVKLQLSLVLEIA